MVFLRANVSRMFLYNNSYSHCHNTIYLGGSTVAYHDQTVVPSTVRHSHCHILTTNTEQCSICREYRNNLRALLSNAKVRQHSQPNPSDTSSHKNHRYMSTSEQHTKIQLLSQKNHALAKQVTRLQEKIKSISVVGGVCIGEEMTTDLLAVILGGSLPD